MSQLSRNNSTPGKAMEIPIKDNNDSFEEFFLSSESDGMKAKDTVKYTLEYIRNRPELWQLDDSDNDTESKAMVVKSSAGQVENPKTSNTKDTEKELQSDQNNNVLKIAASIEAKGTLTRATESRGYKHFKEHLQTRRDREAKGMYYREKYHVKAKVECCSHSSNGTDRGTTRNAWTGTANGVTTGGGIGMRFTADGAMGVISDINVTGDFSGTKQSSQPRSTYYPEVIPQPQSPGKPMGKNYSKHAPCSPSSPTMPVVRYNSRMQDQQMQQVNSQYSTNGQHNCNCNGHCHLNQHPPGQNQSHHAPQSGVVFHINLNIRP